MNSVKYDHKDNKVKKETRKELVERLLRDRNKGKTISIQKAMEQAKKRAIFNIEECGEMYDEYNEEE